MSNYQGKSEGAAFGTAGAGARISTQMFRIFEVLQKEEKVDKKVTQRINKKKKNSS